MEHGRREFLGTLAGFWAAAGLGAQERSGDMVYRSLGNTGERVSAIGFGGAHLGRIREQEEATRLIRTAVDRGITFMDNCWDYSGGRCEELMGGGLRDGYRDRVFLMTKFDGRTKESTARQIDESLQRLQTDHIDLMQYHENIRPEDPDLFFAEDGPVEALLEAKEAGKIRYIGFTGHKDPFIHLRMLEIAEKNNFHFDAAQMPLNILDASFRSFAHQVVPKLVEQEIAVLGMKSMAFGVIPRNNIATATECLHYALGLPTSVVITGCETVERVDQACEAVRTFEPFSEDQLNALITRTREAALSGQFERFKTSPQFDGTARNPEWMR